MLKPKIEALLVAADRPVTLQALALCLGAGEINQHFDFKTEAEGYGRSTVEAGKEVWPDLSPQPGVIVGAFID